MTRPMLRRWCSGSSSLPLLLVLLLLAFQQFPVTYAEETCSASATLYKCPLCNDEGIFVEDCLDCDGYLSTDTKHNICFDRRLFLPTNNDPDDPDNHYHYLWNDLVGAVVWFLMAGVATACGVGGGGIYVPLGILLFQFSPKQASGLSQASIFGASLGGLLLNARNRHPVETIRSEAGVVSEEDGADAAQDGNPRRALQVPHTDAENEAYLNGNDADGKNRKFYQRPLINFDMALFLAPMEMAGAVLGVLVQKILPNWLYLLIAGLVLSFTAYKTYKKFLDVRRKEKAAEAAAAAVEEEKDAALAETVEAGASSEEMETVDIAATSVGGGVYNERDDSVEVTEAELLASLPTTTSTPPDEQAPTSDEEELALRKQYLEDDMRQYPKEKIAALIVLWIGLLLLTLFKGGKGVESLVGITCESPWYGVLIALQFTWIFAFALYYGLKLVSKQKARVAVRYPYLPDDPIWDTTSLRFYGAFTFVAGVIAGLIGIGGGMVLGPLMLVMGIHPRVSSATTATMIVLTSSSVAVIFVTSGLVPWSYAVFYFFVCFAGAVVGKSKIDGYIKKTGRASLLIFILATIIALATLGCFVIMLTRLADQDWCLDSFNPFCSASTHEVQCPVDRMLESFNLLSN